MKNIKLFLCFLLLLPIFLQAAVNSYAELISRENESYMQHNAEIVRFDGLTWSRQYGMKEYYISPTVTDIETYMQNFRLPEQGSGGFRLVKINLNNTSRQVLAEYAINVPADYSKNTINVMLPSLYVQELENRSLQFEIINVETGEINTPSIPREQREIIYEQGFEEDLGNEYEIDGFVDQPSIIFRNICWGILDCESYEDEQSLWCAADLYDDGWYEEPLDPCTVYTNWIWTYFARLQTIDVTVAEELVFEWWTQYSLDPTGDGDYLRVWVSDAGSDWSMIGEYTGYTEWTDMQYELEGFTAFAYYFEFESDDMEWASGIYLDKISIYNMVPNLTYGEDSIAEYPYNYSPAQPHNLRIYYEIFNISNVDIAEGFSTDILISEDANYNTTDDNYILDTVTLSTGLAAGEISSGEIVENLDELVITGGGSLPPGDYHVMFMVDSEEDIDESDEEDNLWAPAGTFSYGNANLTPGAGSSYSYPQPAGTTQIQVTAEVLNDGTEATSNGFAVGCLISDDDDITSTGDNYDLGNIQFQNPIAAGASASGNLIFDLADLELPVSDYWVFFVIDVYAAVNESNELDNTWLSATQFDYYGEPFLEVLPLTLEFTAEAGTQNLNLSSNQNWTASEESDWLSLDLYSGNGDATIAVSVSENTVPQPRAAEITFNAGNLEVIVNVNQQEGTNINYGDVDSNGVVEAYDASLTLQYVVGLPTGIDPFPEICADVDGNGEVTAYDSGIMLQYIVGIIDQFPVENQRKE